MGENFSSEFLQELEQVRTVECRGQEEEQAGGG